MPLKNVGLTVMAITWASGMAIAGAWTSPSPLPRPTPPVTLKASGPPTAITVQNANSAGRHLCTGIERLRTHGDLSLAACKKALDRATRTASEVCRGVEFHGVPDFTGLESLVVNLDFLELASKQLCSDGSVCSSMGAELACLPAQMVRVVTDKFFRIDSYPGELQRLVGEGLTEAQMRELRGAWRNYARALFEHLK